MKLNIFSDFHYCEFADANVLKQAQDYYFTFLNSVANDSADYIFSLGDLATEGNIRHYQTIEPIVNQHKNYMNVLGNHDTTYVSKKEIQHFFTSDRYFVKELEDTAIIALDSTKEFVLDNWGGIIDEEQLIWLKKEVTRLSNKNLIVLSHHPLTNTTFNSEKPMASIENSQAVNAILSRHQKNNLFICGHVHYNSVVTKENWTYIQLGATIDTGSYLEVFIEPDCFKTHLKLAQSIESKDKSFLEKVLHFTANPNNEKMPDLQLKR
ncbi:metallophosphoesterase family protein [Beduini massiliensis]|uniref:metallophosphoesterase family protein n=1 Tax=Beduini massiliensis TaxID=1585974 RepID=UPI00059AB57A|nr:metallophosphoesterase [Beduini massiliensis]